MDWGAEVGGCAVAWLCAIAEENARMPRSRPAITARVG